MNQFGVGAVGKRVHINNLAQHPTLQPKEALELAAWLVATAVPLMGGSPGAALAKFHQLVAEASEGDELERVALEAAEGIDD